MGKASSSKKVARAARAGRTASTSERRDLGFPIAIFVIIVLGISLVVYSRQNRDATTAPRLEDHWHSAFGVYDCTAEAWAANPQGTNDPDGIHSHQDGLLHIHPFNSAATGEEAQLHVFLEAMGMDIDTDAITLDSGDKLEAGADCDGEEAIIQVLRWDADNLDLSPDVYTEDLGEVRFLKDREAFVLALAPEGAEIELPPSMAELDRASPTVIDPTTEQSVPPGAAPDGTVPAGEPPAGTGAPQSGNSGTNGESDAAEPGAAEPDDAEPEQQQG